MDFSTIAYDVDRDIGVLTITLDRPDALNAATRQMIDELVAAFDASDGDDDVRAVIVTGRGRGFCAGTDLSGGDETLKSRVTAGDTNPDGVRRRPRNPGGPLALRIFESLKPVIAAVNGAAVGLGATMTLPMDVRLRRTAGTGRDQAGRVAAGRARSGRPRPARPGGGGGLPRHQRDSAVSSVLSLLALKPVGMRRVSHVDDLAADPAAGLFAGLVALTQGHRPDDLQLPVDP